MTVDPTLLVVLAVMIGCAGALGCALAALFNDRASKGSDRDLEKQLREIEPRRFYDSPAVLPPGYGFTMGHLDSRGRITAGEPAGSAPDAETERLGRAATARFFEKDLR